MRAGAIVSIFRDRQDLHSFAPLRIQNVCKFSSNVFDDFADIFGKHADFAKSAFFNPILMKFLLVLDFYLDSFLDHFSHNYYSFFSHKCIKQINRTILSVFEYSSHV